MKVERKRKRNNRRLKRSGTPNQEGDTLIIKTEQSKYSGVLKAMRSNAKLVDLGTDVRSIKRTRTGDMILELEHDEERKAATCKNLAEEVLGERVEVSALTVDDSEDEKPK